jgi:hypothetical protein
MWILDFLNRLSKTLRRKRGLRGQSHLWWDNYEDCILLLNRDVRLIRILGILCPQFIMRNILVKLLVMEVKLTKRDKFIEVTWLLHKTYLEKMLRSIVCMHIKSGLSLESRVIRLKIKKSHEQVRDRSNEISSKCSSCLKLKYAQVRFTLT